MKRKHYTLEEANAVLPDVKQTAAEIKKAEQVREEKQKAYAEIMTAIAKNGGHFSSTHISQLIKAADRSARHLQRLVEGLQNKYQCEIKGLHPMLVDFYSIREDREVYLCWKEDEDTITHWHDLDAGFSGRQTL